MDSLNDTMVEAMIDRLDAQEDASYSTRIEARYCAECEDCISPSVEIFIEESDFCCEPCKKTWSELNQ